MSDSAHSSSLSLLLTAVALAVPLAAAAVVPASNCYALDNSSYLLDFTDWIGHPFEYDGKDADLVFRFCKDVESRSQTGYIDYGRYASPYDFVAGQGPVSFVQDFYNGDLMNCEHTFDKLGRTAQVNIICGNCLNGECKGGLGCICSVTYDTTMCRAHVEIAIPCVKRGSRVFKGFTVGFNPRSWEVVYDGLTQLGFEQSHSEFSFGTEQTHVSLYLTAVSALSDLVGKPVVKVIPDKGLEVKLAGSGVSGHAPTTLSPTTVVVNWRCEIARDTPYEVEISIPVDGYDPIDFTLTKLCGYRQGREGEATRGWAIFGVISCIFIILSTLSCCGGFIYKTRVERQRGLDALPGMAYLSACLEAVSGPRGGGGDINGNPVSQASWERVSTSSAQGAGNRTYGSMG